MSYSAMRPDGVAVRPAIYASVTERMDYIRKVYSLMFAGLLAFAATVCLPLWGMQAGIPLLGDIGNLALAVGQSTWGSLITLGVLIGTSFVVHSISMVRGLNIVGLFVMAILWGFLTIPLVAFASLKTTGSVTAASPIVFQAAGLTTLVFAGLTSYVFISKKDFSFLGGMLSVGMFLVLGAIIVGIVGSMMGYEMNFFHLAISAFLVILFSGYVLYDTSNVLHHYATDMVVPGALALMVDFIILFRSILMLLVSRD